jgi:hypothetical protein
MSTSTETQNTPSQETTEEKYLKLGKTDNKGDKAVATIRLLDYPGVEVFRHWIGEGDVKYPYNCPGPRGGCPACKERSIAKLAGDEYRQIHRMDHRNVVNILDVTEKSNPKLKIFQLGPAVQKRLQGTIEREEEDGKSFQDPTAYDIKIVKRKTGDDKFDIEYDVIYVAHRELTPAEKTLAANRHDLKAETVSATVEVIGLAMRGQRPGAALATTEQRAEVDKVLKAQKLSFLDLKVTDPEKLTAAKAQEIIRDLG